jgi:hypothetical protein
MDTGERRGDLQGNFFGLNETASVKGGRTISPLKAVSQQQRAMCGGLAD